MSPVYKHTTDGSVVLEILFNHLPASIATYRRIQSPKCTKQSHILATWPNQQKPKGCFAVAYVDRSVRPETEVYFFIHHQAGTTNEWCDKCSKAIMAIFAEIARLPVETQTVSASSVSKYSGHALHAGLVLAGSVHHYAAIAMDRLGILDSRFPNIETPYTKYYFRKDLLPTACEALPTDLLLGTMTREEDLRLVLARTEIPRQIKTLATSPSIGVFQSPTGQPIGWAFLSADGSLSTLHVEQEWRGRGIARCIATHLISQGCGDEGYGHADVGLDNVASRRLCESMGGVEGARVYWLKVDLEQVVARSQDERDSTVVY